MAVERRNSASPIVVVIEETCAWRRLHLVLYYGYIGMVGNPRLTDENRGRMWVFERRLSVNEMTATETVPVLYYVAYLALKF
jgi:hypothetical protein